MRSAREPVGWKLYSDGEALHAQDDAGELLGEGIVQAPVAVGGEDVEEGRPEKDAEEHGERWCRQVQAVPDENGEERVGDQEDGQSEVGEVGRSRFELRPHGWKGKK